MATKIKIGDLVELSAKGKTLKWVAPLIGLCGVVYRVRSGSASLYSKNSLLVKWLTREPIPIVWGIVVEDAYIPIWALKRVKEKK